MADSKFVTDSRMGSRIDELNAQQPRKSAADEIAELKERVAKLEQALNSLLEPAPAEE